jgi:hypothetical protein
MTGRLVLNVQCDRCVNNKFSAPFVLYVGEEL